MNLSSFFAELKRRNVYKVAVAYAVVAWLLIQVATQVFPFFDLPNWDCGYRIEIADALPPPCLSAIRNPQSEILNAPFLIERPSGIGLWCESTKPIPGTLQEGGTPFQTTHWTVVLQAGKAGADESAQRALSIFSEAYWPPLYTFVRRRGSSPADAQDIVQGFFQHLFEQNALSRADQEKGRLRTFLLSSLQNFMMDQHGRAQALKRGGGQQAVSLDQRSAEAEAAISACIHLDDVSSFDLTWASTIARRSWQQMQTNLAAEGKAQWLSELRPFVDGAGAAPPNQQDVADRLGVPIATLRTWLARLRHRYREILRAEVASTVSDPSTVDQELRYLHQILMA